MFKRMPSAFSERSLAMAKRHKTGQKRRKTYKVKPGDDFIKISDKLYHDKSYFMDLIRENPGFNKLHPGVTIHLPDEDPRETRRKKRKAAKQKKRGIPGAGVGQTGPNELETPGGYPAPAQPSTEWWNDPEIQDELVYLMEEVAQSMGLVGLGDEPEAPTELPQEKPSSRRGGKPGGKRGGARILDENVQPPTDPYGFQVTADGKTGESKDSTGGSAKVFRPALPVEGDVVQEPTPTPKAPAYQDIKTDEDLDAWFKEAYERAGDDKQMKRQVELGRYAKLYELWMQGQKEDIATPTPTTTQESIMPDPNLPPMYSQLHQNPYPHSEKIGDFDFVPRLKWGAKDIKSREGKDFEGIYQEGFNDDGYKVYKESIEAVYNTIVIHDTGVMRAGYKVTENGVERPATILEKIRGTQYFHQEDEGRADVGYHFIIAGDGTIYEGRDIRARGTHVQPEFDANGNAIKGNTGSLGIVLIGNDEQEKPTAEQIKALDALLVYISKILPKTNCIAGHGDVNSGNIQEGKDVASEMALKHNLKHQDCYGE
jgi:hypothetical protein